MPTHCVKAGELDLTTASGRMTARITGAVARGEVEHMSERICAQKARATAAGSGPEGGARSATAAMGWRWCPPRLRRSVTGVRRVLAGEPVCAITKSWQAEVPPGARRDVASGQGFSLRSGA